MIGENEINFHRKKQQEVVLVSKVIEDYHGVTASYVAPSIKGTASCAGVDGYLYKLYFKATIKNKNLEFSVPREQYNSVQESEKGLLVYQGKKFLSFLVSTQKGECSF